MIWSRPSRRRCRTREADLLLHVVDCADEQMQENIESVQQVLARSKPMTDPS
jgi:50S ribosomal subunit-associated GTPase HflX